jgi:hypothetical protein
VLEMPMRVARRTECVHLPVRLGSVRQQTAEVGRVAVLAHTPREDDGFGWPRCNGLIWLHLTLVDVGGRRSPDARSARCRCPRCPHAART